VNIGGRRGRGSGRKVRIRVSTLVVHPMQDTARHDPRSPCRIPDAPCKLSRTVSSGTARYVIGPRMPDSLHGGAVPVGSYCSPGMARICSLLHINARGPSARLLRPSDDVDPSLPRSVSLFLSSILPRVVPLVFLAPAARSSFDSSLSLSLGAHRPRVETREREDP